MSEELIKRIEKDIGTLKKIEKDINMLKRIVADLESKIEEIEEKIEIKEVLE